MKSFGATFSQGQNRDMIQNSSPAPNALSVKIAIGEIRCPPVRSLHTMILTPKIAYAVKHAACPASLLLFSILDYPVLRFSVEKVVHDFCESQTSDEYLFECYGAHLVVEFLAELVAFIYLPYAECSFDDVRAPLIWVALL